MDIWVDMLAAIAADPVAAVALVLAAAMLVDLVIIRFPSDSDERPVRGRAHDDLDDYAHDGLRDFDSPRPAQRRRRASEHMTTADRLRGLDLRVVAQAVEDMIIDRQHLTRILGTRALDLWIDLALEERSEGPTLKTRAKIVAFEPVALDEARIAQSARMIKRRVAEELTQVLGVEDVNGFVNGGVVIETAIERNS